jgi:cyclic pyranopterin phosphate synthase
MNDEENKVGMIDITDKPVQHRTAIAAGTIHLKPTTIDAIRKGEIKKGNPLVVAKVAALTAIKQTPMILPMCHQIPISFIDCDAEIHDTAIDVQVTVKTNAQTGVEMEALVGVSVFLNVIWDMTKYLEKDENGQYQTTKITDIRVLKKEKI